jgi:TolB-like protein/DNA-binding winged helix-turn-helix (wHTH) protein/Tfp pilus assembly protein PilF
MRSTDRHLYEFGPFVLDPEQRRLSREESLIAVPPKSMDILIFLVEHRGEVVTKDNLIQNVWPNTFVEEANLSQNVFLLRKALGEKAQENRYIATVPGRGYRFVASVREVDAEFENRRQEDANKAISEAENDQKQQLLAVSAALPQIPDRPVGRDAELGGSWRKSAILWSVFALAVAILLALAERHHWLGGSAKAAGVSSIAVLPLENLTGDSGQDYFADGMTDALITDLAQIGALRVISHTSVEQYKGTRKPLPQIARELNVDAVVEGSVARSGNRVRVNAQLIQAVNDEHLWARAYEGELNDVLTLQNNISRNIADEIQVRLMPGEQARLARRASVKPEAYEAYLKGRYFWSKRTPDSLRTSIDYYRQAIAADPQFAAAYAGLADTYSIIGSDVISAAVASEKARAAAMKAVELDPSLAEGHAALALVRFYYDWNWNEAESECRHAIELNPNYATAHSWFSLYLSAMGRNAESLMEAQRARELDPLSASVGIRLAGAYRAMSQYDQALQEADKTLELDPGFAAAHEARAKIFESMGKMNDAMEEYRKGADLSQNAPNLAALAHGYALLAQRDQAMALLQKLQSRSRQDYVSPYELASIYTALGDKARALSLLEQAFRERDSRMPFLGVDTWMASLYAEPRFQALKLKLGVPGR